MENETKQKQTNKIPTTTKKNKKKEQNSTHNQIRRTIKKSNKEPCPKKSVQLRF